MALVSTARVDLVCEGGGVRGIGLVGAVDALADAGYRFPRVAGSSAGAIVASLVAALQTAGEPVTRLAEMMRSIDYPKFLDRNLIGHVPLIGGGLSLLLSDGVYRGAYLEQLLGGLLADLGVHTFGDLRTGEAPEQFAWSLVVTASDLSRRRLVRIPWDLDSYGIHPDDFSVARAVHASSAIPFVFELFGCAALPGSTVACCRTFRWRCSTEPTLNRDGPRSGSGCQRVRAFHLPGRSKGQCRWASRRSKHW
ncbi:transmembrane protein [Mycobacterium tuberculosis]|nr:transmembrane protein [Mycobacterium tuberculosis]